MANATSISTFSYFKEQNVFLAETLIYFLSIKYTENHPKWELQVDIITDIK